MKINNSKIYFSNPSRLPIKDCNYYAVYDYTDKDVIYKGVFTKDDIIKDISLHPEKYGQNLRGYARKTLNIRGKTGRYEVTIDDGNYHKVVRYKNKYTAMRSISWHKIYRHKCRIIDLKTGEVLGHWNDEEAK